MFLNSTEQRYVRELIEAGRTKDYDVVFSNPKLLEILPKGINKGSAYETLCERFAINPKHTMAIGDEDNDVPMLQKSHFSVAMGNATELLKQHAQYITINLEENGLAKAVAKFLELDNHQFTAE
jgi:hydroxymethylpyrimidine pyrophosphatase-like HAD family hydrolase